MPNKEKPPKGGFSFGGNFVPNSRRIPPEPQLAICIKIVSA
jgi:hypothetical protein